MRQCIFCPNQAKTREEVWPQWMRDKLPERKVRMAGNLAGRSVAWTSIRPEFKIRAVCNICNHGWMSDLENANSSVLSAFMQDISSPLSPHQQQSIARWAMKTAMVMEYSTSAKRAPFYRRSECEELRESGTLPADSSVWIGRYAGHLRVAFVGSDFWDDKPESPGVLHGYVNTIAFGLVTIQTLTMHVPEGHQRPVRIEPKPAPWRKLLTKVHPASQRILSWPPEFSFTDTGRIGLGDLVWRWTGDAALYEPS